MKTKLNCFLILASFLFLSCAGVPRAFALSIGNLDVNIRTAFHEIYDDNITYSSDNKKSDTISNLGLGIELNYEGKTSTLNMLANLNQQFYSQNSGFNYLAEDFAGTYTKEFTRHDRIELSDTYVHSDEPRSFEDELGRTSGRYAYSRNRFDLAYTKDITKQFTMIFSFLNEIVNYSSAALTDNYMNQGGIEADYALSSKDIVLLNYQYSARKFKSSNDIKMHRFSGGLRHYFTNQLYFDARGGQDYVSNEGTDSNGQYISTALTSELDKTTTLSILYLKQLNSTSYTQEIFKSWRTSASLTKRLFKRLRTELSCYYGEGDYTQSDIKDTLKGANIGFVYDVSERISFDVNYTFTDLKSNISSREYTKNRIWAGMTVEF